MSFFTSPSTNCEEHFTICQQSLKVLYNDIVIMLLHLEFHHNNSLLVISRVNASLANKYSVLPPSLHVKSHFPIFILRIPEP